MPMIWFGNRGYTFGLQFLGLVFLVITSVYIVGILVAELYFSHKTIVSINRSNPQNIIKFCQKNNFQTIVCI